MGQISVRHEVQLQQMDCGACGVIFAIPQEMYDNARRAGGWWHCPNGHCRGWEKGSNHTRIKELEAALEAEQQRKQQALGRENEQRARADALEKKAATAAKRAKAGVCPCCNRTFQQLARHMETKHPKHGSSNA
jgi:hypothetical protein